MTSLNVTIAVTTVDLRSVPKSRILVLSFVKNKDYIRSFASITSVLSPQSMALINLLIWLLLSGQHCVVLSVFGTNRCFSDYRVARENVIV